jgi:peptidoglycan hydrolase-like protein with peptidoglycan-binding domain
MTRQQRYSVQENLSLLGHDPRGVDGVFGPGTRTAIRLWQRANDLTETGYLDPEQFTLLINQADAASRPQGSPDDRLWENAAASGTGDAYRDYLLRFPDGGHASEAREALKRMARLRTDAQAIEEMRVWRAARQSDRPWDYRNYLRSYPVGIWQPEAEERLAALAATPAPLPAVQPSDPQADEAALGLARTDRLSVEQRLNYLRFPPGSIDGFFDASTRQAIAGYQRSRGFEPTGYLDQPTIVRLLDETGGSRPGIVIDGAAVLRQLLGGN